MRTDLERLDAVELAHEEDAVGHHQTPRLHSGRVDVDAGGGRETAALADAEAVDARLARRRGVQDRAGDDGTGGEQTGAEEADERETTHMGRCL